MFGLQTSIKSQSFIIYQRQFWKIFFRFKEFQWSGLLNFVWPVLLQEKALHKNKSQHIQKTMSYKKLLYLCNCYLFIGHKQVKLNNFCFDVLWDTFSVNCNSKLSRSTGSQGLAFGSRFSIEIIRFCTI